MKSVKVLLSGEAQEELKELNEAVNNEISKNIKSSFNQTLLRAINQKIELLKKDPEYGIHIARNKIPLEYVKKYDVTNIWKINLSGAWRMIYTLHGNEVEIIAFILEIVDHKEYDKRFGY